MGTGLDYSCFSRPRILLRIVWQSNKLPQCTALTYNYPSDHNDGRRTSAKALTSTINMIPILVRVAEKARESSKRVVKNDSRIDS